MGLETGFEAAKRRESVLRLLKTLGLEPDQPPLDFDGAYAYALVEFGVAKPRVVLELFRHEQVRQAFQTAFEKGNWGLVSIVVQDLIDWHTMGETFSEMDVDPRRFIIEFAEVFQTVVDRSRPAYVTRQDQKLDTLIDHQSVILCGQTTVMEVLQHIQSSVSVLTASRTSTPGSEETAESVRDRVLDTQISQAGALVNQGKILAAKGMLDALTGEIRGQKVSDTVRFRFETNMAACLYNLSENEQAAEHFDRR